MPFAGLLPPGRRRMLVDCRQCGVEEAGRSSRYIDGTESEQASQMDLEMFEGRRPGCLQECMTAGRR
jgi:hypothetical protein